MRHFNLVPILLLAMLAGCLDSSSSSGSDKKPDDSDNGSSSSPLENIAGIWKLGSGFNSEPVLISRSGKTTLGDASVEGTSVTFDGTQVGEIVSNSRIEFTSITLSRTEADITAYTSGGPSLDDLAGSYTITPFGGYEIGGYAVLAADGSLELNLDDGYDSCSMTTQLERPYSDFNEYVASISDSSDCTNANVLRSDSLQVLAYFRESESKLYLHLYGDDDEPWLILEVAED